MRCIPVLLFLFCGIALHAGVNLFSEDTSFETGTQNFRYYRSNFPIRQIRNDAAHGTSSLEIDSSESWAQDLWMYSLKKIPTIRSVSMPAGFPAEIRSGSR